MRPQPATPSTPAHAAAGPPAGDDLWASPQRRRYLRSLQPE